jgi:hypothetical protein
MGDRERGWKKMLNFILRKQSDGLDWIELGENRIH